MPNTVKINQFKEKYGIFFNILNQKEKLDKEKNNEIFDENNPDYYTIIPYNDTFKVIVNQDFGVKEINYSNVKLNLNITEQKIDKIRKLGPDFFENEYVMEKFKINYGLNVRDIQDVEIKYIIKKAWNKYLNPTGDNLKNIDKNTSLTDNIMDLSTKLDNSIKLAEKEVFLNIPKVKTLPENIKIEGIEDEKIFKKYLDEELEIPPFTEFKKDVFLSYYNIKEINNITAENIKLAFNSSLEKIGENVKVNGKIDITYCVTLKSIKSKNNDYIIDNNLLYQKGEISGPTDYKSLTKIDRRNLLLLNSDNSLFDKLINEEIDNITSQEIDKYLNNKHKFGTGSVIEYCLNKKAFDFISKNGYIFNDSEKELISNNKIKNLYENKLIIQNCYQEELNNFKNNYSDFLKFRFTTKN